MTNPVISGVYAIVNKTNGHQYIGSAVDIHRRWKKHVRELNRNEHHSHILQRAWIKHGKDKFDFIILKEVEKSMLISAEQSFIDSQNPYYNVSPTAGNRFGCKNRKETNEKISKSHLGLRPSAETIKKLRESHLGYKPTKEARINQSVSAKGNYRGWSDKPVIQLSRDKKIINRFKSIMDAERETGIVNTAISRCCKGGRPTAGGFIWQYAERGK